MHGAKALHLPFVKFILEVTRFVFVSSPLLTAALDDVFDLSSHQYFKSGPVMLCRLAKVHFFNIKFGFSKSQRDLQDSRALLSLFLFGLLSACVM